MRCAAIILVLGLGGSAPFFASTPIPYAGHCLVLDRVAAAASDPRTRSFAIDSLEKIALGRVASVSAELEAALGEKAGVFQAKGYTDPPARACAVRSIGRTALDEAVDFLAKLTPADVGPDPSGAVWSAAQIALQDAQFRKITDPYMKTKFLEGILAGTRDGRGPVPAWAVDELCERGAQKSLPLIQSSIRHMWSGQYGEDEIEFCEARIRVIMSNPDRVKALASVLAVGDDAANTRLVTWAVNGLNSMKIPTADAEVDRFAREIDRLPEGSPAKDRLGIYRMEIRYLQAERVQ
jgi:hypothetical protein